MANVLLISGSTGGGGGGEGPPGPRGEFLFRGEWLVGTEYAKGDAAQEGGTTYASLKGANIGHKPSELGEWWAVIAKKGDQGVAGERGPEGVKGLTGNEGPAGPGVPVGGTTGQVLAKKSNTNFDDEWVNPGGLAALEWLNVEAVNAKLEQPVAIQVAVFNGLVFIRGKGKVSAEIAAKGILFTLPAVARPVAERILTISTAATTTQELTVKTNGECETSGLLAAGKVPTFDGLVFSL
jgi:hypothetical protein